MQVCINHGGEGLCKYLNSLIDEEVHNKEITRVTTKEHFMIPEKNYEAENRLQLFYNFEAFSSPQP